MRVLVLLRGAPGCGKSTFIREKGLEKYSLSADRIRMSCRSPQIRPDGLPYIPQDSDNIVWQLLFSSLEERMKYGEFTIIDATNSKTKEMTRYKQLCDDYRYRMYCVDFTDIPIEECKRRNLQRDQYKWVPESVIDNMYSRFMTQKIPSGVKVIKPDDLSTVYYKKIDLSRYRKIHVIGDIHGCYTALNDYLSEVGINSEDYYIFVGDYLDRGIENVKVVKFLLENVTRENFCFLEGNHERHIWNYSNDEVSISKEFEFRTKPQLEEAIENGDFTKRDLRGFYRKLGQCAYFSFHDKDFFICHGGIPYIPDNLSLLSTEQMIKGVGEYKDHELVADTWMNLVDEDSYLIHGHRNTNNSPVKTQERVYNLEGKIEFGGCLRCVTLEEEDNRVRINEYEKKNPVFIKHQEWEQDHNSITESKLSDVILSLRKNSLIQEKVFGDISSFNFTHRAFHAREWNSQTITARGLYINTKEIYVQARGYQKFFHVNEMPETKLLSLRKTLKFPVSFYVKENGFLGLLSLKRENNEFFVATKSVVDSSYVERFKNILFSSVSDMESLRRYLSNGEFTFVFECIDPENDPHIIQYEKPEVILLDIIRNDIKFSKIDFEEMKSISQQLNLRVKKLGFKVHSFEEFEKNYEEIVSCYDYSFGGERIEGFVVEDANGFMLKIKTRYYDFWKRMRSLAYTVLKKGYTERTQDLTDPLSNLFYGFLRDQYEENKKNNVDYFNVNIIELRNRFFEEKKDQIKKFSIS